MRARGDRGQRSLTAGLFALLLLAVGTMVVLAVAWTTPWTVEAYAAEPDEADEPAKAAPQPKGNQDEDESTPRAPSPRPLFRSPLFHSSQLLSDSMAGSKRDEMLQMIVPMLTMPRRYPPEPKAAEADARLPGVLTSRKRELTQMTPLLLCIADDALRADSRSDAQRDAVTAILPLLESQLGAPAVTFDPESPEPQPDAADTLAAWFETLVEHDAPFDAMLTGGGHPKFTFRGPGLVGMSPPTALDLGEPIARAEFGDGLHVEAFAVEHEGKAAVLRGTSREGEPWSILLTDADSRPYRHFSFQRMKVDDLGPFGWRVRGTVSGEALVGYLTPEGAFRFYHTRFRGDDQAAQGRHLQALVSEGAVDEVRRLLDAGADPETTGEQNTTLLHLASAHGQLEVVKLLLERGAAIDTKDEAGLAALQFAAFGAPRPPWDSPRPALGTEHVAVAKLLLERGVDVNVGKDGEWGWGTPLHLAAFAGRVPMARFLIEHGADVNAKEAFGGSTPLLEATRRGVCEPGMKGRYLEGGDHLGVMRLLLEHGADLNVRDGLSFTLLQEAASSGSLEMVNLLIDAGAKVSDKKGFISPLMAACQGGHLPIVKRLVEAGANPMEVSPVGMTPLHFAAMGGRDDVVRYLLEKDCDVGARKKDGETPLHLAAQMGHVSTLSLLVAHGGDLKVTDNAGRTLLHTAAGSCSTGRAMLEYLVSHDLDIHAETKDGKTPLQLALAADCLMGSSTPRYLQELGAER